MLVLVRVDDRLLHGQIICAWVPFLKADALLVASDEAAGDSLASEIMESCGCKGLSVYVKSVDGAADYAGSEASLNERLILIVGGLDDVMRLYEDGLRFDSVNLGNIHHDGNGGRRITPSVAIDGSDEAVIEMLASLGVNVYIRDVPAGEEIAYASKKEGR